MAECKTAGSANSVALRNHGLKAILPGKFPDKTFPVEYARKDVRYALALGAKNVDHWFAAALQQGHGSRYLPVVSRISTRR